MEVLRRLDDDRAGLRQIDAGAGEALRAEPLRAAVVDDDVDRVRVRPNPEPCHVAHRRHRLAEGLERAANEALHDHPGVDGHAGGGAVLAVEAHVEGCTKTGFEGKFRFGGSVGKVKRG